jgi:glucose-6-phosphate isomerase
MGLAPDLDERLAGPLQRAWHDLVATERGDEVNADEKRRVGHYWLRAPELAPAPLGQVISDSWRDVERIAHGLSGRFARVLVVGIGGSALGPQLVAEALARPHDARRVSFLDNTDPDGMTRVLREVAPLSDVLVVVISKSGGTPETKNGYLVVREAFQAEGLSFAEHAVAITRARDGRGDARARRGGKPGGADGARLARGGAWARRQGAGGAPL